MGNALGWVAVALAAVAFDSRTSCAKPEITYQVRMVEAQGVGWREGVFNRLKPVTRQGAATIWTVPRDTAKQLLGEFSKRSDAKILQAPRVTAASGMAATVQQRRNRPVIVQAAWSGEYSAKATESENVRVGWHTTMVGRKLDQGILVQIVLEDTEIRAVHHVNVPRPVDSACASTSEAKTSSCPVLITTNDRMPIGRAAFETEECCEGKSAEPQNCCQSRAVASKDDSIQKVVLDVPEIDSQEVVGEWLVPNGEVLLVSFGAHTVADKNGMAVVKERLAFLEANEAAGIPMPGGNRENPAPVRVPGPQALDFIVPPTAIGSPVQGNVSIVPILPPVRLATPAMPSRSIPQGINADGTAADLPPVPESENADDSSSLESSEPMASPQTKKAPQPKPQPASDTGMKKVGLTPPEAAATLLPSLFTPSGSTAGVQILLPIKLLSIELPRYQKQEVTGKVVGKNESLNLPCYYQQLEIEVTGKVVPQTEGK